MGQGLEAFIPTPREVTVGGRSLSILPLRMGRVPAFARAIAPALPLLTEGKLDAAIVKHSGAIREAVVIGIETEAAGKFVDELWPHEFMHLAEVVFEVNVDFFARHVLPEMRVAAAKLTAAIETSLGDTGSPGSSPADGASPTSST